MEAVKKAKDRLKKYPLLVSECKETAGAYATCVVNKSNIEKDSCLAEFQKFKDCLIRAAAKHSTRL